MAVQGVKFLNILDIPGTPHPQYNKGLNFNGTWINTGVEFNIPEQYRFSKTPNDTWCNICPQANMYIECIVSIKDDAGNIGTYKLYNQYNGSCSATKINSEW